MNKPQLAKIIPIRKGVGRTGLKRKVPSRNALLKPKVFSQSHHIQRPKLPSQKPQIPSSQGVIHPTFVERKHYLTMES